MKGFHLENVSKVVKKHFVYLFDYSKKRVAGRLVYNRVTEVVSSFNQDALVHSLNYELSCTTFTEEIFVIVFQLLAPKIFDVL